jgi:putative NADH-flavin reductase
MKIIIFGASGRTGRLLLSQALERGHTVTAFVRNSKEITQSHSHLKIVKGDIANAASVGIAVKGHDIIVNTLGVRFGRKEQVCTVSTGNILKAMKQYQIRRLIVLSGAASGKAIERLKGFTKWFAEMYSKFGDGNAVRDKDNQYKLILDANVDYTIVNAPWLTNGKLTKQYEQGEDLQMGIFNKISRADVAHFILTIAEHDNYVRKEPLIFY